MADEARSATDLDIRAYAALVAALAEDEGRAREQILRDHGFDEESWTRTDDAWQARLSSAIEGDSEGVPELVAAYASAFAQARAASAGTTILTIERFAEATREIQRRGDPATALAYLGITLADFLKANEHWTRRMIADPSLLERFQRGLGLPP